MLQKNKEYVIGPSTGSGNREMVDKKIIHPVKLRWVERSFLSGLVTQLSPLRGRSCSAIGMALWWLPGLL